MTTILRLLILIPSLCSFAASFLFGIICNQFWAGFVAIVLINLSIIQLRRILVHLKQHPLAKELSDPPSAADLHRFEQTIILLAFVSAFLGLLSAWLALKIF